MTGNVRECGKNPFVCFFDFSFLMAARFSLIFVHTNGSLISCRHVYFYDNKDFLFQKNNLFQINIIHLLLFFQRSCYFLKFDIHKFPNLYHSQIWKKNVLMLMCFSSNTLFIFKEINVLQSGGETLTTLNCTCIDKTWALNFQGQMTSYDVGSVLARFVLYRVFVSLTTFFCRNQRTFSCLTSTKVTKTSPYIDCNDL